jgi:hypothetical protein
LAVFGDLDGRGSPIPTIREEPARDGHREVLERIRDWFSTDITWSFVATGVHWLLLCVLKQIASEIYSEAVLNQSGFVPNPCNPKTALLSRGGDYVLKRLRLAVVWKVVFQMALIQFND